MENKQDMTQLEMVRALLVDMSVLAVSAGIDT